MTSTADPWSFFDSIYCISIDNRIDRRNEAKKQFASCGLLERVEFVLVKKHHTDQEEGIFQSHMSCIKKGLLAGAQHILIFEDDILIRNFQADRLHAAATSLNTKPNWNAFFLGAITRKITKTSEPSLTSIRYRCLAHAYALNRPFAEHMVQQPWQNVPFDNLLQQQCNNFFGLSPMIAFQSPASTDNQTIAIDKVRRFFGGLPFIQRANEFFQVHKTAIICGHLLLFMTIALLAVTL